MPANENTPPQTPCTAIASPAKRHVRILLVEDNRADQGGALLNLQWLGHDADIAHSEIEALSALEGRRYDIVLLDCQMPDLNGYEVTKEIRQRERGLYHTWIIALTAQTSADREKCLTAGMDDYLSKPLGREELRVALERSAPRPAKSFDEEALRTLVEEGDFELSELIELFLASAPTYVAEMQLALEKSNPERLLFTAHTLKGTCGNLGALPLHELCAQIEQAGLSTDTSRTADLIMSAASELDRLTEALESYRNDMRGAERRTVLAS